MKAIVFIDENKPDRNGVMVDIRGLWFPASVPLRLNFDGATIGTAKLARVGHMIIADLVPVNELQGRYFPAIGYRAIESKRETVNLGLTVTKAAIMEVSLCQGNSDKRIPPVVFKPRNRVIAWLVKVWLCRLWGHHDWTCAAAEGIPATPEQLKGGLAGFWDYATMYCKRCGKENELSKKMNGRGNG